MAKPAARLSAVWASKRGVLWYPPGALLSENHWAEDLAQGSGTEQVLGAVVAHS